MYNVQNIFFYHTFHRYLLIETNKTKNILLDRLSNILQDNLFMMTCTNAHTFYSIFNAISEDNDKL